VKYPDVLWNILYKKDLFPKSETGPLFALADIACASFMQVLIYRAALRAAAGDSPQTLFNYRPE